LQPRDDVLDRSPEGDLERLVDGLGPDKGVGVALLDGPADPPPSQTVLCRVGRVLRFRSSIRWEKTVEAAWRSAFRASDQLLASSRSSAMALRRLFASTASQASWKDFRLGGASGIGTGTSRASSDP
jgi:hypothetical protein